MLVTSIFSISPNVFRRLFLLKVEKSQVCLTPHNPDLTTMRKKPSENIVGKGENASNQHFLLFAQCFLPNQLHQSSIELHLKCQLQLLSNWDWSKILSFGKELMKTC